MRFLLVLCALACAFIPSSLAFDTGHHYDATRNALMLRNFSLTADAINIIQAQNWATDWNALGEFVNYPDFDKYNELANLLHCNNLYNSTMIKKYELQLVNNSYATYTAIMNNTLPLYTQESKDDNGHPLLADKKFMLLSLMGVMFHVTQDFYTHSNWYTTLQQMNATSGNSTSSNQQCDIIAHAYRPQVDDIERNASVHTYYYPETDDKKDEVMKQYNYTDLVIHGAYSDGINKDAYNKEHFENAYVNAVIASLDWIDTIRGWIQRDDPSLWSQLQNYTLSNSKDRDMLNQDVLKLVQVSAWITNGFTSSSSIKGHWKGPGSGDLDEGAEVAADYARGDFQEDSPFQQAIWNTALLDSLAYNLDQIDSKDALPMMSQDAINKLPLFAHNDASEYQAVVVRTHTVNRVMGNDESWFQKTKDWFKSDTDAGADWSGVYGVVSIEGQFYKECPYKFDGADTLYPWWQAIHVLPRDVQTVSVTYDLAIWTEDDDDVDRLANVKPLARKMKNLKKQIARKMKKTLGMSQQSKKVVPHTLQYGELTPISHAEPKSSPFHPSNARKHNKKNNKHNFHTRTVSIDTLNQELQTAEQYAIEVPMKLNYTGVYMTYSVKNQTVDSGLPASFLHHSYLKFPDNVLTLATAVSDSNKDAGNVTLTITTRTICSTSIVMGGTEGLEPQAQTAWNVLHPDEDVSDYDKDLHGDS